MELCGRECFFNCGERVDLLSCSVNMNVGCCKEEDFSPSGLYYTHIHLGANHLCVPDGMLALWLSGSGVGDGGQGHEQQAPHCPSLCLFLPSPPRSLLQFPSVPGLFVPR